MRTLLLGVLIAGAIASAGHSALAQKAGGILKLYHRGTPPSASIHEEATISTVAPFMSVYNNLVIFNQHEEVNSLDTIVPDLATEWSWSDDGTKLTFKLRDGVNWHDGKPFTSADVKCTWDMVLGKSDKVLRKNPRKSWYWNLKEITTNGDQEVTFHLGQNQPSFLAMLAGAFSPVYPCHVDAKTMRTAPIGTGPFKFKEMKQNEVVSLVKNENYWKKGLPYLDGHEWTIVKSRSTRILGFAAGEFDMTFDSDVTIPLLRDVQSQAPEAICKLTPTGTAGNLLVNRDSPPFDDRRIREAMALTIDRQAFIDILGEGQLLRGGAMMPPPFGIWGMPKELQEEVPGYGLDVEANREKARAIMREVGYGPDNRLSIKVTTRNIASYRDASVILIDHLKQVYIDAELDPIETATWYGVVGRKAYQVGMNIMGVGIDDPDVVFFENYACGSQRNYTGYCNKDIQALMEKQSAIKDIKERQKLVWEIDRELQLDHARPMIYWGKAATCWQPFVKNVTRNVNSIYNAWRIEDWWLDK